MRNFRTPFLFKLTGGVPLEKFEGDGSELGVIGPFMPLVSRVRETPGDPYPDAFSLPRLPLPLLMRVSRFNRRMAFPRVLKQPTAKWLLSGITKDSTGAVLGFCEVELFDTARDVMMQRTTSDVNGAYEFSVSPQLTFYLVAYKSGSPDVAGTTVNTLTGTYA